MNDLELLQQYWQHGSQPAFTDVVARHVDLVYSAARRQVGSPDLAREVAQTVFLELAASRGKLRDETHLVSWLYVAARRRSVDVVRREASRHRREQEAAVMTALQSAPDAPWSDLAPVLDEAIGSLDREDRTAVLLRFFENRSLGEVGRELGSSDDAAQKRVARALDRLKTYFAKRGVMTTAAALATGLSAHALQTAPAGLAAAISAASLATLATGPQIVREGVRSFFSPTLQKMAMGLAASGLAGLLVYQAVVLHRQERDIANLHALSAQFRGENELIRRQRGAARANGGAPSDRGSVGDLADPEFAARIRALLARIAEGKKWIEERSDQRIPEMRLLTELDWIAVMQEHTRLETDDDFRRALSAVRMRATGKFAGLLQTALKAYVKAKDGWLPDKLADLLPFFEAPVGEEIIARYELKATGRAEALAKYRSDVVVAKLDAIVDQTYDGQEEIGLNQLGFLSNPFHPEDVVINTEDELKKYRSDQAKWNELINPRASALRLYRSTHHGQYPQTSQELAPYFQELNHVTNYLEWAKGRDRPY